MKLFKRWKYHFYRLQQNLAITNREAKALWALLSLLLLGIVVSEMQKRRPAFSTDIYTETDSLFLEATKSLKAREHLADSDSSLTSSTLQDSSATIAAFFTPRFPVNINTANSKSLVLLPRIGPKMAQRIIAYRDSHGPFKKKSDLMKIKGIGEKTFEQLVDKVSID